MSYIGKEPIVGNFQKCDAITTSSTATYNLTVSSVAVFPETTNNCIVSLNGVIQAPTSAYTISGSQIVFASSLASSDVIDFILILGSVLSVGTPTDRTVTLAKMATGTDGQIITYDASGNPTAVGPGSDGQVLTSTGAGSPPAFEAIPGGGKIGQVVSTTLTTVVDAATANSFEDITGLSVNITPAATSSKVLIIVQLNAGAEQANSCLARLMRDSTVINVGTGSMGSKTPAIFHIKPASSSRLETYSTNFLDSPSTTSQVTYKMQWMEAESNSLYLNRPNTESDNDGYPRTASTITVMEVLA